MLYLAPYLIRSREQREAQKRLVTPTPAQPRDTRRLPRITVLLATPGLMRDDYATEPMQTVKLKRQFITIPK